MKISRTGGGILLAALLWVAGVGPNNSQAQVFSITSGTINTCTGIMLDSGGQGGGGYGNNENFTVVICPDNPGDVISLVWTTFNLDQTGPNPLDRIRLWDGNSIAATFLGEYTGTQLQGLTTQATTFNTTGCLTVQFISNATGTGIFAASITCETPCDRPTAEATMSQGVPALICVGEELTFDGSLSYAAPGFTIAEYTWDFADGNTANTPLASHSWDEPGEYVVQLYLLDDNDCVNTNLVDFQVLVSTTPSFTGTMESTELCLGASVDLSAVVTPVTWTGVPDNNFGPPVYLPDNLGIPFTSDITFTQFAPGQTLTDINDIFSVCVDMEHSFMGDLVISLTCPNGQNVIFHQQGGGGTDLGIPGVGANLGTCWEYCWSPTATNGTWVANSGGVNTLPSGTYGSLQPMSQLEGCPLNGTWTITYVDLWAADDGWLCGWEINVNPAIIPDVTQFTPVLGTTVSDSAWWSGPNIVIDPNDPLQASANPNAPGDYDYTFTVVDNFGCSYDTTITITIQPQIEIDAGPAIVLCSDPLPMAGAITANGPPTDCEWTLILYESFGDSWNGGANLQVIIDGVASTYAITAFNVFTQTHTLQVSAGSTVVLQYTAGTIFNGENSFSLFNDQGATVYASPNGPPTGVAWSGAATCDGGTSSAIYEWSPSTGLDDPSDPTTNVYVTQPTWFYLSVYPDGFPQCAVVDSVLVSPDPSIDAGENNAIIVCASDPIFLMTDSLGGTPDPGGVWTTTAGATVPNSFNPDTGAPGLYTYTITSAANCVATAELDITILPADDPSCCGVPDAGEPAYSCNLTIALNATPGNTGVGVWSGPAGAVFADASSPQTSVTMPAGQGGSHWFYWSENDGVFCNTVDSVLMTFTDQIIIAFDNTNAICYTYCDGTSEATVTGGNAAAGFTYDWSNGSNGLAVNAVDGLCAGDYTLTVTDDNGCEAGASFTITEPVLLEIDAITSDPVTCFGDCDGRIDVFDTEAVEYSYNDGASWSASSSLLDVCAGLYPIQIRDAAGCIGTGTVAVGGPPPVVADFDWGPIPANVNNPTIFFTNTSTDAIRYEWNIAGLASTTEVNTVYQFTNTEPGNYNVCLTAYNVNDCADEICYTVVIDDVLFTYVPNAFTPDGDGVNDGFMMSTNIPVISDFNMLVFDRWGQVVFETNDPYTPWLGSYRNGGTILSTGVYAYRIRFGVTGQSTRRELVGHVTLLR
jgi:gliding motility-associated-like protein